MKDARVHDNNNVEILDENNEITIIFCENVQCTCQCLKVLTNLFHISTLVGAGLFLTLKIYMKDRYICVLNI